MFSKNSIAPLWYKYAKCVPSLLKKKYLDKKKKKNKEEMKRDKNISRNRSEIVQ